MDLTDEITITEKPEPAPADGFGGIARQPSIPPFSIEQEYETARGVRFEILDDFVQSYGSTLCVARVVFTHGPEKGRIDLLSFDALTTKPVKRGFFARLFGGAS